MRSNRVGVVVLVLGLGGPTTHAEPLPGTVPLIHEGDLAADMVAGIGTYLDCEMADSATRRAASAMKEDELRERLARILGVVDQRLSPRLEYVDGPTSRSLIAEGDGFQVYAVRWAVLPGVDAEGLLFEPETVTANVVLVPDVRWTPEMLAGVQPGVPDRFRLAPAIAAKGARVLIPTLIDRGDTHSGNPTLGRQTNLSHREFLYRMAYQMGRHILGYEIQKVLAGIDWMIDQSSGPAVERIGVIGYGEGGLIAQLTGALDTRIRYVDWLGHGGPSEVMWSQPIDRNIWGFLSEFGYGRLHELLAGRVEGVPRSFDANAPWPEYDGPATPKPGGRNFAAPGRMVAPERDAFEGAEKRAANAIPRERRQLNPQGQAVLDLLTVTTPGSFTTVFRKDIDTDARMKRQFDQLVEYTQKLWRDSDRVRREFWSKADTSSLDAWKKSTQPYRDEFRELIGELPEPTQPKNPKSRLKYDTPKWRGYEVTLDLHPDVFAYGILLLPKDMTPGEKRPVVVCQHGLEGRPTDICEPSKRTRAYNSYGARLADLGFIVYAPQNPYIGKDDFRVLQRKANPLGLSLFSFIVQQHKTTLDWLKTHPNVDPKRIGFYGLSYGGKTAMRVPALLEDYCLSICSGDFNEWIGKNVSVDLPMSYMFTGEYEMPEFNLGETFNYAEMAYLIAPRPFMVERGHDDGVGTDEMVAWEFAKVRRMYTKLSIPERTTIEFFDGGHEIHLQGTLDFLRTHLDWPEPDR